MTSYDFSLSNPLIEFVLVCPKCGLDEWHCRGYQCDNCGELTHDWHRVGDMCICDNCFKVGAK